MYDTLYHKIQFYILQMIIVSYFTILSKIKCIIWYNIMVQVCILQYTDMIYIIYYNIMYFMISWYKIALFHTIWYWIVLWNKYCIMNNMKLYMQHNRKLHHMIWSVIAFSSFVFLILFLVQIIIWNSDFHYFHKESSFAVLHYCFIWKISCKLFVNLSSSSLIKTTPLLLTLVRVPEKEKEMVFIRLVILLSCIKCNAL